MLLPYVTYDPAVTNDHDRVYANVSAKKIREIVAEHEGLRRDSAELPPLIELDENGYEWAAAAVPPTPSPEDSEDSTGSAGAAAAARMNGSPFSTMHMGAPPPPPPPIDHSSTDETTEDSEPPFVLGCDIDIDRAGYLRYRRWARSNPDKAQDQHSSTALQMGALTPPQELRNAGIPSIAKNNGKQDNFE